MLKTGKRIISSPLCVGFPPIAAKDARVLILGTLPSEESLRRAQYYGKKENAFWKIMGELVGAGADLSYAGRAKRLKESRIALWDVCACAKRAGSLDSNIDATSVKANDFIFFFRAHKKIAMICFNGQASHKLFKRYVLPSLPAAVAALPQVVLPSTSPAYARLTWRDKLARWREVLMSVEGINVRYRS